MKDTETVGEGERKMNFTGIDIGGTKCAVVTGNEAGICEKIKFETTTYDQTIDRICDAVSALGTGEAIGISCGGPLDSRHGLILSPPNLPGWDNVPVTAMLEEKFGVPAGLQNDANACALAEWKYGAGRNCDNMIFLTFGTGMGAGLILNGRLYSGTSDAAGEIGHMRMERFGPSGYGKAGSFEGFCSGGGIAKLGRMYAEAMFQRGSAPSYCKCPNELEKITAKSIAEAAIGGDADAAYVYDTSAEMLGAALAILTDLLNPQRIVIGSIYARCRKLFQEKMIKTLKAEALPQSLTVCEVVPAELGEEIGDYAALCVAQDTYERRKKL